MTRTEFLNLHKYLHNPSISAITYQGQRYPFSKNTQGLRFVVIDNTKYIQQNPNKDSETARLAADGHLVTWGIHQGSWDLAVDNEVQKLLE